MAATTATSNGAISVTAAVRQAVGELGVKATYEQVVENVKAQHPSLKLPPKKVRAAMYNERSALRGKGPARKGKSRQAVASKAKTVAEVATSDDFFAAGAREKWWTFHADSGTESVMIPTLAELRQVRDLARIIGGLTRLRQVADELEALAIAK